MSLKNVGRCLTSRPIRYFSSAIRALFCASVCEDGVTFGKTIFSIVLSAYMHVYLHISIHSTICNTYYKTPNGSEPSLCACLSVAATEGERGFGE